MHSFLGRLIFMRIFNLIKKLYAVAMRVYEVIGYLSRDIVNYLKFGKKRIKSCELIYVKVEDIKYILEPKMFGKEDSGRVIDGDWDLNRKELINNEKYNIIYNALRKNIPWSKSGIFEHYALSKKYSHEDLICRYANISYFFNKLRMGEEKFKSRQELFGLRNFRERGGVMVHKDREGNYVFSGAGFHRLAIAKTLGLEIIPCMVGVVHYSNMVSK